MYEFVSYLNTLHRCNGNNENATAEANKNTEFAQDIIVEDEKILSIIHEKLTSNDGKVLLTGFAGDGKTTLAQIIVSKLVPNGSISDPIMRYENTTLGRPLVVIKDLSENAIDQSKNIISEYLLDPNCSLLLVSNTGTVLDRLKENAPLFSMNSHDVESEVLKGISGNMQTGIGEINLGSTKIGVINLVRHDNLKTARKVLDKIVNHPSWNLVDDEFKKSAIYLNVLALRIQEVQDRLFLMYNRLYEYGERLTMRFLVEHFAFIITGNQKDQYSNRCFFDNVFGEGDINANTLAAINLINRQYFGSNIPPRWKRRIWITTQNSSIISIYPGFDLEYKNALANGEYMDKTGMIARLRAHRILYFLSPDPEVDEGFLCSFLNSPGLAIWCKIQKQESLDSKFQSHLVNRIRHVVKEYFAGVKLPENDTEGSDDIYITMSRQSSDIRQSAQVVISSFKWKWRETIDLLIKKDSRENNQLYLIKARKGKSLNNPELVTEDSYISLPLPLPFLDYLLKRHMGNIARAEFQNYQKRLDSFKIAILQDEKKDAGFENDRKILLVRLNSKRMLKDITFKLSPKDENSKKLEVL